MPHTCNVYCTPEAHCDLMYASPNLDESGIWQSLGATGVKVIAAHPAREAPDLSTHPEYVQLWGRLPRVEATQPWLVWTAR